MCHIIEIISFLKIQTVSILVYRLDARSDVRIFKAIGAATALHNSCCVEDIWRVHKTASWTERWMWR